MDIDITKLIAVKQREIRELKKLRPKIETVITEAKAAEEGKSTMSDKAWEALRDEVEEAMHSLGLIKVKMGVDPPTTDDT